MPGNEGFSLVDNGGLSLAEGSYPPGFFGSGAEAPSGSIFAGGGYEVADSGQIASDVSPDAVKAQNDVRVVNAVNSQNAAVEPALPGAGTDQSPGLSINVYWDNASNGAGSTASVGPISGGGLSGSIDAFEQGLSGDFAGIRAALNSGDPLIDPRSILNAGKSVLSFLGDSAIEMIPGSGAFEFGQAARARNDALGQSLRSGISNAVGGLFDNFSLAYDSYRAGDTFGAGSILGDMAYGPARDIGLAIGTMGLSRAGLLADVPSLGSFAGDFSPSVRITGSQWNEYLSSKYGAGNVTWTWPSNQGFVYGADTYGPLGSGQLIGRIGGESGTFVSPYGTTPETLSLRPGTDLSNYNVYRIEKPIQNVRMGPAAPAFDMPGYGMQFQLPMSVSDLLEQGYLSRFVNQ